MSKHEVYLEMKYGDTLAVSVNKIPTGSYGMLELKELGNANVIVDDIIKKINPTDEEVKDIKLQLAAGALKMMEGSKELLDAIEEVKNKRKDEE